MLLSLVGDPDTNVEYANSKANPSVTQANYESSGNGQNQDDFQTGDFIVNRQDIFLDWPVIWRVETSTLLQKFEPFHSNNKTIYRSLSTVRVSKFLMRFVSMSIQRSYIYIYR